ncbi:MAG TPA: hypothetical protein VGK88_04515 [bacterium]|jgi:hypothetical protein
MKILIITVTVIALLWTGVGRAQGPTTNAVIVCNEVALRIRVSAPGMTVQQRIDTVYQRIVAAWAKERITAGNVMLRQTGTTWSIYAGGTLIITVQQVDAQANGTTTAALAQAWHARLRDLLPRCRPDQNPPNP